MPAYRIRHYKTHSFSPVKILFKLRSFDQLANSVWVLLNNFNTGAMAICMMTVAHSFDQPYARYRRVLRTQPTAIVLNQFIIEHEHLLKAIDKLQHIICRPYNIYFTLASTAFMLFVDRIAVLQRDSFLLIIFRPDAPCNTAPSLPTDDRAAAQYNRSYVLR